MPVARSTCGCVTGGADARRCRWSGGAFRRGEIRRSLPARFECPSASEICSAISRIGTPRSAPDIHRQAVELIGGGREQIGARDVFDEGKIARLFAIFVKNRRQIVEQARAENRDHAGVWIEDRLARPVGAGIAQARRSGCRFVCPRAEPVFPGRLSLGHKRFRRRRARFPGSAPTSSRRRKAGNAPTNRRRAVVPPGARWERRAHAPDNGRRLRCKPPASSRRRLF